MERNLPNDPQKYIYAYINGGIYITTCENNGDSGICGALLLPNKFDEVSENVFTFKGSIKKAAKILEKIGLTYNEKLQNEVKDMNI